MLRVIALLSIQIFLLLPNPGHAQRVSRNDSLRTYFQEGNQKALNRKKANFALSKEHPEADMEMIRNWESIRNDTTLPCNDRLGAQWGLVSRTLYRDPRNSRKELDNFVRLATEFKDSASSLAHAYSCLGTYYQRLGLYDSARIAFQKELEVAEECHHPSYQLNALIDFGLLHEHLGRYDSAVVMYQIALDSSISWENAYAESRSRINLGNLNILRGDYRSALYHLEEAFDLCTIHNLNGYLPAVHIHLGDVNLAIGEYALADTQYQKALKWAEINGNHTQKHHALHQYSKLREAEGRTKEAVSIAQRLVSFSITTGIADDEAESYYLLADLYRKQGRMDSAYFYIAQSLAIYEGLEVPQKLYKALGIAGTIHLEAGDIQRAGDFCLRSYELNKAVIDQEQQADNCGCLYQVNKANGNHKQALKYLEEQKALEEILSNKQAALDVLKQQMNSDFRYTQFVDSLGNQIRFERAELENQEKLDARARTIWMLCGGIAFILVIAVVLWRAFQINRRQKNDLDKLNRLNKQIFSIISHDFKGPLTSMQLLADTLSHTATDEETLRLYLKDIRQQITQTSNVLDSLLNWAKLELSIDLTERPTTSLLPIVREMSLVFQKRLNEKGIRLEIDIPEASQLRIHPDLMRIALRNLISNGIKYSHPGGVVQVRYAQETRQLSVKDEGVGMDEKTLSSLTREPLFSQMGTDLEPGFGIGLYITSELLKRSGWRMQAESKLGKGSIFIIEPSS